MKKSKYDHKSVEKKWQEIWKKEKLYTPDIERAKKPFYNLWMFPYPSAEGLHAGHAFASTGSDIYGRFKRMHGFDVFQPIGYDSFGIHSENFAIKVGEHPSTMLARTTKNYERQMRELGHGYDWTRTVTTSDVSYYKWTQWLFVTLFKAGLAYRKKAEVNWCPSCKTVLADEQVIDGKCERCSTVVEKKQLEQWFFRITKYADKLLSGLEDIDWSHIIKIAQRNWIGEKHGISISYPVKNAEYEIECWTSRPDTNFGATFIVISPNHPLVNKITTKENKETVKKYIKEYQNKEIRAENTLTEKVKTGVFTGSYAVNRLNGEDLPIWVSDYVVEGVGTGAVVGVPGHDKRDFEFAQQFGIKVVRVVAGSQGDTSPITSIDQVQEEQGKMINSEFLDGMNIREAISAMMDHIEKNNWGKRKTSYHLRDWLISRQRYWGPPIPMIYCEHCDKAGKGEAGWYAVEEENLPVELPYLENYKPKGDSASPLADHPEFYEVACPECGKAARRETDVSDTFLDSSWYFLRYPSVDAKNATTKPFDIDITKKWLPVDLYFGGAEHAVLHLMYARFITMVLHDLGLIEFSEPFTKMYAHGLMIKDGAKMSKSRGNVVNPDQYIEKFGADTMRLYLMFMGPMDGSPDFRDTGIEGMQRFTQRLWAIFEKYDKQTKLSAKEEQFLMTKMHQTIKKVTSHIDNFHYNTALASIMEYVNTLSDVKPSSASIEALALLVAPFAPHLAEEVWQEVMGKQESIHKASWPKFDPKLIIEDTITIPVQVNGKLRDQIQIPSESINDGEYVASKARESQKVTVWLNNKKVKKTIYVEGRLLNFVI